MPNADIETVDKIIDQLGELPAAPEILCKAIRLTSDLKSSIDDVSKNISADQTLTANVIRLSNSPLYGRVKKSLPCMKRLKSWDSVASNQLL
jgi:HD-like signal output (HDOD) protein